jgi:hypothetical protein
MATTHFSILDWHHAKSIVQGAGRLTLAYLALTVPLRIRVRQLVRVLSHPSLLAASLVS